MQKSKRQAQKRKGQPQKSRIANPNPPQKHPPKKRNPKKYPPKSVKKTSGKPNRSGHIFLAFIGVLFAAYLIGYYVNSMNRPTIVFATVDNGSIDLPVVYNGIIIRDEKLYTAGQDGVVYFAVNDKERVKKDTVVCRVSYEEVVETLTESLSEIETSIMEMQQRRSDITAFADDAARINKLIKESVDNNIYKFLNSDVSELYLLREEVDKNLTVRNQKLLNEDRGSISELVQKKGEYEARINENIAVVKSQEVGMVSYLTDGLEDTLTFGNLLDITEEQTTMKAPEPTEVRGQVVDPSKPVFKIIKSNEWYLAAYLDNKIAVAYEENTNQTIYVNKDGASGEYNPLTFTVSKIIRGENRSYVLFRATKDILSFADARSIEFKTERSVYSGLKIPNTAIIDRTFLKVPNKYIGKDKYNISYIIKRDSSGDMKVNVNPQSSSDEEYTYISTDSRSLLPGDVVVSPGDTEATAAISEIVNIKGVFRVNNGLAEFVKINVEGELVENSGYCVLNPELNPSLRVQDRIIPEPRNIVDGQIVY